MSKSSSILQNIILSREEQRLLVASQNRRVPKNRRVAYLASEVQDAPLSLLDRLYTPEGVAQSKRWFNGHTTPASFHSHSTSSPYSTYSSVKTTHVLSEPAVIELLTTTTSLTLPQCLDVFDIFDHEDRGMVTFSSFYAIVAVLASCDVSKRVKMMFVHGRVLFFILGSGSNTVTQHSILVLFSLCGIPENMARSVFVDLGFGTDLVFNFTDFETICFAAFSLFDAGKTEIIQPQRPGCFAKCTIQ
eukprot:TRINITY_DN42217_c0_g1_i1.p1 TRINITY_DN42217_c0_g1~~TRINITY_DN42217_c0_g1_i1.p1  ORF type:complete len:246 (-),score=5.57 TRINITY_DN42217_c0_g1_i1:28-765(-)